QHPDGHTAAIHEDIEGTCESLEKFAPGDGDRWREVYEEWARVQPHMMDALFTPFPPVLPAARLALSLRGDLLRFARIGLVPVRRFAEERFRGEGGGWLLGGNALHTDLTPDMAGSALFGLLLCGLGQTLGFPFPKGGAQRLTDALVSRFEAGGGRLVCGSRVERIEVQSGRATGVHLEDGTTLSARRAVLADVIATRLYGEMLPESAVTPRLATDMENFQLDNSTFKVNWALDGPIPWVGEESRRAATIHLAGGMDELSDTAAELVRGQIPSKPFLILGQYSMADPGRAPEGCESAWAYTHTPQDPTGDAGGELTGTWDEAEGRAFAERMEARIEEAAPGFRKLIRARNIQTPVDLEAANANLVGGALNGGTAQIQQQLVLRPAPGLAGPSTPVRNLYLASSSAHPGGGVHGGPGANAARAAVGSARRRRTALLTGAAVAGSAAGALATRRIRS
ncbi:MAG: NAD(P)/FAD-dependent oxidoreductase, partial [Acidobacteria bacterium]|nr:NAD(P)/FAD-dependent oxidoreductase [Acidobacteriota bacterium]